MGLLRYDMNGHLLGAYWHYGHETDMIAVDVDHDGRKEILLGGSNDAGGAGDFGFVDVIALDPGRIVGATEATTTEGFGLPLSAAEKACLRLPNTELNRKYRSKAGIGNFFIDSSGAQTSLHVWWHAALPDGGIDLEYEFSPDLSLRAVKSSDKTTRLLAILETKGEISPAEIQRFLPSLRAGVEYWDGKSWRSEPLPIA